MGAGAVRGDCSSSGWSADRFAGRGSWARTADHSTRLRPAPRKPQTSARGRANDGGRLMPCHSRTVRSTAAGGEKPPVSAEGDALDRALVTGQGIAELGPGLDIPQSNRVVGAAGGERPSVGAEGDAPDEVRVAGQGVDGAYGRRAECPTAGSCHRRHRRRAGDRRGEKAKLNTASSCAINGGSSGIWVRAFHSRIALAVAARGDLAAIRTEGDGIHRSEVACAAVGRSRSCVRTSHRRTVPSFPPETSRHPGVVEGDRVHGSAVAPKRCAESLCRWQTSQSRIVPSSYATARTWPRRVERDVAHLAPRCDR